MRLFFFRLTGLLRVAFVAGAMALAHTVQADELKVYAAASLMDVMTRLADIYQQTHSQTSIRFSFAGSSTLARQIEQGAPADVFIFADKDWVDYLQKSNQIDAATRIDLLTNQLVLVAPVNHKISLDLHDSANSGANFSGKLCTGDPDFVPVGKYAKQALHFYGWWDDIQPRLVTTEDVRTALSFVGRGECALGIVYKTDALISKNVTLVASFPDDSHAPIVYPAGLTRNAAPEANAFWAFLQSAPARNLFVEYGFGVTQHH